MNTFHIKNHYWEVYFVRIGLSFHDIILKIITCCFMKIHLINFHSLFVDLIQYLNINLDVQIFFQK